MFLQFSQLFSQRLSERQTESREVRDELKQMLKHRSPQDRLPFKEWLTYWREVLIGTGTGLFLGAMPGTGGVMSAFTSYALASRLAKNRGKFGTGVAEGVAAAEAGNSATCGPTLIPLMAFGIPGSGMAALFMGAFMLQGISPGPGMIRDYMDVMLAIFIIMLLANGFNLVISKVVMIPVFARLGLVSSQLLIPILMPLLMIGVYSVRTSWFDVLIMVAAGLLGMVLRRFQVPIVVTIVAFMIGPLVEKHFGRGLILAESPMYWFTSPIALGFYIAAIVLVLLTLRRRRGSTPE
jgi:putative tricarboxylic transport membrane protein